MFHTVNISVLIFAILSVCLALKSVLILNSADSKKISKLLLQNRKVHRHINCCIYGQTDTTDKSRWRFLVKMALFCTFQPKSPRRLQLQFGAKSPSAAVFRAKDANANETVTVAGRLWLFLQGILLKTSGLFFLQQHLPVRLVRRRKGHRSRRNRWTPLTRPERRATVRLPVCYIFCYED